MVTQPGERGAAFGVADDKREEEKETRARIWASVNAARNSTSCSR